METRTVFSLLIIFASLVGLGPKAFSKSIFSEYNLGLTVSTTTNYAAISYETAETKNLPENCETSTGVASGRMRCSAFLAPDGDGSYSLSAFLEKPFKRTGLFYFEPGFTVATVTYTGGITAQPGSGFGGGKSNEKTTSTTRGAPGETSSAPLDRAYIYMYGLNWQSYLRFGITPRFFPDVLASVGLGIQTVGGSVKVFTTKTSSYIVQPEGFGILEAVFVRVKGGYISIFGSMNQTLMTPLGTNLIQDNPSGTDTTDYRLGLKNQETGLRILLPF